MNVLIVEDEPLAAERLAGLLQSCDPAAVVMGCLDAVEDTVQWLRLHPTPALILMDIHLSDGLCFDIFAKTTILSPIIFTTAYDQYAIEAFKVNSIDYLLKPVDAADLSRALDKLKRLSAHAMPVDFGAVADLLRKMQRGYKSRFLVRYGDHLQYKTTEETAYFYAEGKTVYLVSDEGRRFIVEYTLEELEGQLNPHLFFRANRKFLVRIDSVKDIRSYTNSRLRLFLKPGTEAEVLVSREKAADFRAWLDK